MDQLSLFPPTPEQFEETIKKLKDEISVLRKATFAQISDLKKTYDFITDRISDLDHDIRHRDIA